MSRVFEIGCVVEISHTFDSFHARVELDDGLELGPADRVLVHGEAFSAPYGHVVRQRRRVTVTRAYWWQRLWSVVSAQFKPLEFMELSFSSFGHEGVL